MRFVISFHQATNLLARIAVAAMQCGIGERFLQRDEEIQFVIFTAAELTQPRHHAVARRGHRRDVAREDKLRAERLRLCGWHTFIMEVVPADYYHMR